MKIENLWAAERYRASEITITSTNQGNGMGINSIIRAFIENGYEVIDLKVFKGKIENEDLTAYLSRVIKRESIIRQ